MSGLSLPLRLYIILVTVSALLLFGSAVWLYPLSPAPTQVWLSVALTIMVGIAHLFPIAFSPKTKISVETIFLITAALVLPPPVAIGIAAVGIAAAEAIRKCDDEEVLFNASQTGFYVGVGAMIYWTLSPPRGLLHPIYFPEDIGAILLALSVMYLLNGGIVALIVALQLRQSFGATWMNIIAQGATENITMFAIGVTVASLIANQPWAILLAGVPCVIVYQVLKRHTRLRGQTWEALEKLADVIDLRDSYTHGHSQRVAEIAEKIACELRLDYQQVQRIKVAARMHDLGKIGVTLSILQKTGSLNDLEWADMRRHPEIGTELLTRFPDFRDGALYVLYHHEQFNGSGYPKGLCGTEIPLGARIVAVADAFDAMTSNRPYRQARTVAEALHELERYKGVIWDPTVVDALRSSIEARNEPQEVSPSLRQPAPAMIS